MIPSMEQPIIGINLNFTRELGDSNYTINNTYVDAVYSAGGVPLLLPPLNDQQALPFYLAQIHGMLFIGGKDYPPAWYNEEPHHETNPIEARRAEADRVMAGLMLNINVPVLAICGGHQLLNIVSGGKIIKHIPTARNHSSERYHEVTIAGGTILKGIFGATAMQVNSSHHQAIDPQAVGQGLQVVARAADGIVEAIESTNDRFLLGVQWHPERIKFPEHREKIFGAFIRAAGQQRVNAG